MPGRRCINVAELRQMACNLGPAKTAEHLTEALERKWLRPDDFSLAELLEGVVADGAELLRSWRSRKGGGSHSLMEAGTVDYSAFSNITGQIFFTQIKDAYEMEEFVFSKLIPTTGSPLLDTEKIPGFGDIGDQLSTAIPEGEAYPQVSVSEDYIELGPKRKRGGVISVTKEAIAGDRTGQLLQRCQRIGEFLGYSKEARIIDTLIDGNAMAQSITAGGARYHWKGTSYSPYQASSPWINVKTSTALSSWKSVEAAELILAGITDPYTGLPIMIQPTHLIVPPDLMHTAKRIVTATNVQTHAGGYPTSGDLQDFHAPSPLDAYKVVGSRLLKARMTAAGSGSYASPSTAWFLGNPAKAIVYKENWGVQTQTMGANSHDDFWRDIVSSVKVSERGHPGWLEPRLMVKCTS